MYDIAIIGSGPAGATLARLIGNRYKVILLERRTFQDRYTRAAKMLRRVTGSDAQRDVGFIWIRPAKISCVSPQMFAIQDNEKFQSAVLSTSLR